MKPTRATVPEFPEAQCSRKHRVADPVPPVNEWPKECTPAESRRGGVDKLVALCRSLDRLLWTSLAAPQREETRDE